MSANDGVPTPEQARADLVNALNAIEDRLNVPRRAKAKFSELKKDNPNALVGAGVGAAAVVGLAVWGIVRAIVR